MKEVACHQEGTEYRHVISERCHAKTAWPCSEQCCILIDPSAHSWQEVVVPRLGDRADEAYGFERLPEQAKTNDQVSESPAALRPELVVVRDLPRHDAVEFWMAFPVADRKRPPSEVTFVATSMRTSSALGATELRNAVAQFCGLLDTVMEERDADAM